MIKNGKKFSEIEEREREYVKSGIQISDIQWILEEMKKVAGATGKVVDKDEPEIVDANLSKAQKYFVDNPIKKGHVSVKLFNVFYNKITNKLRPDGDEYLKIFGIS
jgi:CO dehydrogenase/acetyl-CoA synthase alpha subunit